MSFVKFQKQSCFNDNLNKSCLIVFLILNEWTGCKTPRTSNSDTENLWLKPINSHTHFVLTSVIQISCFSLRLDQKQLIWCSHTQSMKAGKETNELAKYWVKYLFLWY